MILWGNFLLICLLPSQSDPRHFQRPRSQLLCKEVLQKCCKNLRKYLLLLIICITHFELTTWWHLISNMTNPNADPATRARNWNRTEPEIDQLTCSHEAPVWADGQAGHGRGRLQLQDVQGPVTQRVAELARPAKVKYSMIIFFSF